MWSTLRPISRLLAPLAAAAVLLQATPSRAARFRGVSTGSGAADGVAADEANVNSRELATRRPIRKPVTDKREYLYTTFDSGLRVLAVQDPEAEKASFAVAVEAGSLEDPPDFQGLAHFCEHMVFLGSKKYPDKDAFSTHLALHGGTHNAYTADEETVYFGEIGPEGLDKALDIFAQFFITPSFKKEMVDKEIHAVDSEHKKNQPDTQRRLWHLLHSKANPKNPTHQFKTGDLKTLKETPESQNKSLVEALQTFHQRNYCPGRLHLVLVANESTEELLALGHSHFDALPRTEEGACKPRPVYFSEPAYSLQLGNLGRRFTVGTHGAPQLWLMLPTLPLQPHYKELAEAYLWHALGHYGPGGLKALLLREDLSQSYSFYAENSVAGSMILVSFALTEKGAKHTDTILEYFFAYIKAVKDAGVNRQLLDNMQQLRQVEFDYQEKHSSEFDFVSSLGGSLPKYASEDVLTGGVLIDKPDVELIKQVLACLMPNNMNMILVDPSFNESLASRREQYYDFGYEEAPIEMKLLARLGKASGHGLAPPPDLQYVPRKLELISEPSPSSEEGPRRLLKSGRVDLWWLGLGEVRLPKAVVSVKLGFSPSAMGGVKERVLAALHARLVQLVLEEPSDALQTCGLTYSVSAASDGLSVSFSGFDEHFMELVQMVTPRLRSPGSSEADFEKARRQFLLDLADITRLQPYQHAMEAFEVVSIKDRFSRIELIQVAQDAAMVNFAAHRKFIDFAFAEAQLSVLFAGNIGSERSSAIAVVMEQMLGINRDLPEVAHGSYEQVIDPEGEVELRLANPIAGDPNSATLVAYQFGVPRIADRVHLAMLGEVMDRPVFEALRTERQLGYVVFGYVAPHASIVEVRVLVQGFREAPDTVEGLIEGTVQNLTEAIAKMSPKEFETRKQALRTALSKKAATMAQFAGRYWGQIWDQTYCFRKQSLELQYLDSPAFNSSKPLVEAWRRAVAPQTSSRRKISVKLFGAKAVQAISLDKARHVDKKVITLANSREIDEELEGESYWPHHYVCE